MTSFSLETYKIAVLPIADRCKHTKNEFCNDENNPNGFLRNVGDWFKKISHNRCRLDFTLLPALVVQQSLNSFSTAGGMGPPPGNSQMLVEKVLSLADDSILRFLHITEGRLAIVAPGRFKPHTWHIPNGGKPILRVNLDDVELTPGMELSLGGMQYVDATEPGGDYLERIVRTLLAERKEKA